MIKNAYLSIKKSIGKTILLFIIIFIIANLVIAGFSIKSASIKATEAIQSTLGNDVTLQVNFRNMMKNRETGEAVDTVSYDLTLSMADQLKKLKYVENYNYTVSLQVDTSLTAVENETQDESSNMGGRNEPFIKNSSSFTVNGNTTMEYLKDFTNGNFVLDEGYLLTDKDKDSHHCVIETNLAKENDLKVGDTFEMISPTDSSKTETLEIVGIYEIQNTDMNMGKMNSNPVNTIYTDISVAQMLNNSAENLTSATYYLDNPENAEAFQKLAKENSDIDFDVYTLTANDQLFKNNSSSLENISSFSSLFLIVVIVSGCTILCLILALTIRNRYYEIGVFLSLGQSKIKIILQQFIEIALIAALAFVLSLATGKMTSNIISGMLTNQNEETFVENEQQKGGRLDFNKAFETPEQELDVSLTSETIVYLALTTGFICIVSTMIPTVYVLRLTPREILMKKEG
ncbi:MAG: ABC transporter permease [Faecalibacillus sp.]